MFVAEMGIGQPDESVVSFSKSVGAKNNYTVPISE